MAVRPKKVSDFCSLKALCSAPRDEKSAAPKCGRRSSIIVKFAENVFGDISENLNSENENSEVNEALDDDTIMEEVF